MRVGHWFVGMVVALTCVAATSAEAQMRGGGGGAGRRGGGSSPSQPSQPQTQKPDDSAPPRSLNAGPQVNGGTLLCASREDLMRYQQQNVRGAVVDPAATPPDCRTILKQTTVQILDRDGPSRTQILTLDDLHQTGWTNAYLPDKS